MGLVVGGLKELCIVYLSYFDESGDDGNPGSSPLYVQTAIYLHHRHWNDTFEALYEFRRRLKTDYGLPIRLEIHVKPFLLNKRPYQRLKIPEGTRVKIIDEFCEVLATLPLKTLNVVIDKDKIISPAHYDILEKAMEYTIQRLENDLNKNDPSSSFLIITDEGRVGKMRRIARKVRRMNFIPSRFQPGTYLDARITKLIEDPLPKSSNQSYFIQASDFIATVTFYYQLHKLGKLSFPRRFPKSVNSAKIEVWMKTLLPILNTHASYSDQFGVVCYPK